MAAVIKLALPNPNSIPERKPDLMPFHIAHTGPAPIRTYFRPKPTPPSTIETSLDNLPNIVTPKDEEKNNAEEEGQGETQQTEASASTSGSSTTLVDSQSSLSSSIPISASSIPLPESTLPRLPPSAPRYTAAFRGRSLHGVSVPLPPGYTGVILRGPGAAEVDVPHHHSSKKTRKGAMDVDAEDEEEEGEGETRTLRVDGRFEEFVLWTPDFPVDDGRDEVLRGVGEWIGLSAEVRLSTLYPWFVGREC